MTSRRIHFAKWEGLGNDFVLVDAAAVSIGPDAARALCDRRFGIGADGVLVVDRSGPLPRMIVWNADGSRPEMCGNGLRCVAAHLAGADAVLTIATDAGDKDCAVTAAGPHRFDITVEMGAARLRGEITFLVDGREHTFHDVDVGNPHAITFAPYADAAIDRVGPAVAVAPAGGTNVEFCRVEEGRIVVVVWERGVGRTLACGTGACAVAAAACDTGRASFGVPIRVALPGGELILTVTAGGRAIRLRGPARRVFSGEIDLA